MQPLLIYIHGFNSSPLSLKAQTMVTWCRTHRPDIRLEVPQLPSYPQAAATYLDTLIRPLLATHQVGLVGSSLGGYLSTWLNARYGIPAVLINPAVKPYELLVDYLGEQVNPYTQEVYTLTSAHIDELKALDVVDLDYTERLWLLQQEGDEVLDYRQAVSKYAACQQTVEPNGDHSFVGFERYPSEIIRFLGL
ncbi:esterase YqiA [Thaumasiovibrio sp. DFM-14]|uniref:esterase YqiA n=1 Tax=Thaumasiovibrio sp. DFM-14 TaxID=3384792 RepID=UPI0039A1F3E1